MAVKELTDATFDAAISGATKPVLVDFWASWCGPCRIMSPVIDQVAEEMGDKLEVCKLNVEDNQATAMKYQVMSIPTIALFKDGAVIHTMVGAQPKEALIAELERHLN